MLKIQFYCAQSTSLSSCTISAESVAECRYYRPLSVQLNSTNKILSPGSTCGCKLSFFDNITILLDIKIHFDYFKTFQFFLHMSHLWYTVSENDPYICIVVTSIEYLTPGVHA